MPSAPTIAADDAEADDGAAATEARRCCIAASTDGDSGVGCGSVCCRRWRLAPVPETEVRRVSLIEFVVWAGGR